MSFYSLTTHWAWRLTTVIFLCLLVSLALIQPRALVARAGGITRPGELIELRAGPPGPPSRIGPPTSLAHPQQGASPASATFLVTYNGFSAPAQAAFQAAVNIWATQISSPVPIRVNATWTTLGTGVLGSASAHTLLRDFPGAPMPGTWYPSALANKLAETDLDPGAVDIDANFNSTFANWYYGADGHPSATQYDLMTVVLHELGHGLGFVGTATYSLGKGSWGLGSGFPAIYDRQVVNGSNQALINTSLFPNNTTTLGSQLTSNNLFLNGAYTVAAAGGKPRLYVPSTWQQGSSYAHLDESTYPVGNPNSLMTPQLGKGEAILNPGPITLGLFADMGWAQQSTATATPTSSPSATPTVTRTPTTTPGNALKPRMFLPAVHS